MSDLQIEPICEQGPHHKSQLSLPLCLRKFLQLLCQRIIDLCFDIEFVRVDPTRSSKDLKVFDAIRETDQILGRHVGGRASARVLPTTEINEESPRGIGNMPPNRCDLEGWQWCVGQLRLDGSRISDGHQKKSEQRRNADKGHPERLAGTRIAPKKIRHDGLPLICI